MQEFHDYKGALIVLTDEGPMGYSDGAYIACEMGGRWKFFYSQGEFLVNGFENPPEARTKLQAHRGAEALIDQDLRAFEASKREYLEQKKEGEIKLAEERAAKYVPTNMREFPLPLQLFLDLRNALPQSHALRLVVTDRIRAIASREQKAHWTRGIREVAGGNLEFSEATYMRAVWRGKQETRTKSAFEEFERLRSEIELVVAFAANEDSSIEAAEEAPGKPLVELPDYSSNVEQMRREIGPLRSLASRMSDGLGNILSPAPSSPGLPAPFANSDSRGKRDV